MDYGMTLALIVLTLIAYRIARYLFLKYPNPLFNMVLLGTTIVIGVMVICDISYAPYEPASKIMTFLLGPATVALAIPLYKNRQLLKDFGFLICLSVAAGSFLSMASAMLIIKLGGLDAGVMIAAGTKSVTAPVAVEIVRLAGGDPSLAVAFVVATGTLGAAFGRDILTLARIKDEMARGLSLGTVAHAQGAAMGLLESEKTGAMGSSAMALAAVFASLFAPLLIWLLV